MDQKGEKKAVQQIIIITLAIYLLVLAVYDMKWRAIPRRWARGGDILAYAIMTVRLAVILQLHIKTTTKNDLGILLEEIAQIVWAASPGWIMLLMGKLAGKIGKGDGSVLFVIGSMLPASFMWGVWMLSLMLQAVAAGVLLVFSKVTGKNKIPYLPFLAGAFLILVVGGVS